MNPHLSPHLTDDELIALLYGLGDAEGHVAGCAECAERWSEMQRALGKVRVESAVEISGRKLASTLVRQRQQILERLEHSSRGLHGWRWAPAAAAAALLAVTLFLSRPFSAPSPAPVNAESDAQLFTDVYSMEQDVEPRAAAPIRSLFQEASFEKEGQ